MCEMCRDPKEKWTQIEEIDPDEADGAFCEGSEGGECTEPPRYRIVDRDVTDHLCEEHGGQAAAALGSGLMTVYAEAGLSDSESIRAIVDETAVCSWVAARDVALCGRPARFAKISVESYDVCDVHKSEMS